MPRGGLGEPGFAGGERGSAGICVTLSCSRTLSGVVAPDPGREAFGESPTVIGLTYGGWRTVEESSRGFEAETAEAGTSGVLNEPSGSLPSSLRGVIPPGVALLLALPREGLVKSELQVEGRDERLGGALAMEPFWWLRSFSASI